jgi:hypothetical protein
VTTATLDERGTQIARASPGGEIARLKTTVRNQVARDVITECCGIEVELDYDVIINHDSRLR